MRVINFLQDNCSLTTYENTVHPANLYYYAVNVIMLIYKVCTLTTCIGSGTVHKDPFLCIFIHNLATGKI